MLCTCTCSRACAYDAKIMRSRNAQCKTKESPKIHVFPYLLNQVPFMVNPAPD